MIEYILMDCGIYGWDGDLRNRNTNEHTQPIPNINVYYKCSSMVYIKKSVWKTMNFIWEDIVNVTEKRITLLGN